MRIAPYGMALERVLYPAWEAIRGRPSYAILAQLQRSERASLDQLEAMRAGLLRRLARHAYAHSAHYRTTFDAAGVDPERIRAVADVQRLPLLTRTTAQASVDLRTADWPRAAFAKPTSGSTGEPLVVRYSTESRLWRDATRWRGFGWAGYRMGQKAVHIWGVPAAAPRGLQRLKVNVDHVLRRDVYVSCLVRSPAQLRLMVDTIRRERPDVLLGYAQAVADLARFVLREGLRDWDAIPVVIGAERLWGHDRADIVAAFGPAVFETYGCREFMLMGSECEAHDGFHESAENLIVETVVREGDGSVRPAAPGEQGEVAVTDLHNLACPFIRYLTGDLAVARAPAPCACGRSLPRFGPVAGRVTETLHDVDGNPVDGIVFAILFGDLNKHTRQFQVVQRKDRSVVVRIVPKSPGPLAPAVEALMRAFIGTHLRGVPLDFLVVDQIRLTRAGKLQRVVVER